VTIRGISLNAATGAMRQLAIAIRYAVIVLLNKTIGNKESRIFPAITIPTIKKKVMVTSTADRSSSGGQCY
jgi:hypothetical protein